MLREFPPRNNAGGLNKIIPRVPAASRSRRMIVPRHPIKGKNYLEEKKKDVKKSQGYISEKTTAFHPIGLCGPPIIRR